MDEDTKQAGMLSAGAVIVLIFFMMSVRSCTIETAKLNADLQAKCIAASGYWEPMPGQSTGRCIVSGKAVVK